MTLFSPYSQINITKNSEDSESVMQFANEDLDTSSQPIFPEPVKVHPEVEDEMSRRIKSTLGEYTQIKDFFIRDPNHLIGITDNGNNVKNLMAGEMCSQLEQSKSTSILENETNGNNTSTVTVEDVENGCAKQIKAGDNATVVGDKEVINSADEADNSSVLQGSTRRSSLKRQCKDKSSFYDYKPLFNNIRSKKLKNSTRKQGVRHEKINSENSISINAIKSKENSEEVEHGSSEEVGTKKICDPQKVSERHKSSKCTDQIDL